MKRILYLSVLLLSLYVSTNVWANTIWSSQSIPSLKDAGPDKAVEVGIKFRLDVGGRVNGIRFYKSSANTGIHIGNLWSSTGVKLASATFKNETASGWQQVNFPSPVTIVPNKVYVASYHTKVGHYSDDPDYFTNKGVDKPPLHALKDGINGNNGVFAYGSASSFPSQGWRSSNYWVDVVFTAGKSVALSLTPTTAVTQIKGSVQFKVKVVGASNQMVKWTVNGGTISSTGLFRAPNTAGRFQVVARSVADPTKSATATVIVSKASTTPTPITIFYDSFNGTLLNSNWKVISRHGEYYQSETECNIPQQVSVANSMVTISTAAQSWTCGDFYPDGTVRNVPSAWPYITGDIQWSKFNFTYGTVEIRAKFPDPRSNTWPATWLLGSNCQATNPYTGDTGVGTCPDIGQAGYTEIDLTECYSTSWPWCQFHVANPQFGIGGGCDSVYPKADTNWHVYRTIWTASSIKQYMDGILVSTCNQRLSRPMFLIIQIQTGGISGVPNNAFLPATLSIDYVKVTQP
jgi:hypothetical protein